MSQEVGDADRKYFAEVCALPMQPCLSLETEFIGHCAWRVGAKDTSVK